ncbi:antigen 5 like allergen Cul n 1-like [Drosophila albomicans]|uniref:Venom allergen-1 n=1 Tax=Drosophila albomicans TaxID=7291 RepID=A0A6P8ZD28_DROAB|nr:antigen 5 like allergen Cul n 1-like [Drosophila albomicans]
MTNIPIVTVLMALSAALTGVLGATDYCKQNCRGKKHIGCNNDGAWGSSCPSDRALVSLSDADKNVLLASHNGYRSFIAGGGESKLKPACRMATMQWDDELAYLASLNVRSCQMKHDGCRNTDAFQWAGQNLYRGSSTGPLNKTASLIQSVDMWYSEVKYTEQSYIDAYPGYYNGPAIGHFTTMVADRNTHVGCAASTYSVQGQFKDFLLACNYAATNVDGIKMYNSCSVPASKCTTGVNPSYKFLCSVNEVYDVNNLWY